MHQDRCCSFIPVSAVQPKCRFRDRLLELYGTGFVPGEFKLQVVQRPVGLLVPGAELLEPLQPERLPEYCRAWKKLHVDNIGKHWMVRKPILLELQRAEPERLHWQHSRIEMQLQI